MEVTCTFKYVCILSCCFFPFSGLSFDSKIKIDVTDTIWRPLVVEVGAFGSLTGISKIAASVIGPLADRNVSVFCLSTNLDDYVLVSVCVCVCGGGGGCVCV